MQGYQGISVQIRLGVGNLSIILLVPIKSSEFLSIVLQKCVLSDFGQVCTHQSFKECMATISQLILIFQLSASLNSSWLRILSLRVLISDFGS